MFSIAHDADGLVDAVHEHLKQGVSAVDFGAVTEVNLHAPALLPDAYCGDVQVRLNLYKRLATADKPEQLDALLEDGRVAFDGVSGISATGAGVSDRNGGT